jgi:hypothetical protein
MIKFDFALLRPERQMIGFEPLGMVTQGGRGWRCRRG